MFILKIFYHDRQKAAVTHYLQEKREIPACITGISWATKLEFHLSGISYFYTGIPIYNKADNGEIKHVNWKITPYSL